VQQLSLLDYVLTEQESEPLPAAIAPTVLEPKPINQNLLSWHYGRLSYHRRLMLKMMERARFYAESGDLDLSES
jgi:hypothetical protein